MRMAPETGGHVEVFLISQSLLILPILFSGPVDGSSSEWNEAATCSRWG